MNAREREIARRVALRRQLNETGLTRREVARMGLLLGGGALLGTGLRTRAARADDEPVSPPTTPWVEPLPLPKVLGTSKLSPPPNPAAFQYFKRFPPKKTYLIRTQERPHSFHRELPDSPIFGHGGTFPGPTIDARYGEPVVVRFVNELPANHKGFGIPQIITHLHNFHTASESDGGPWDWITPGQTKDHHYTMARAGFSVPDTIPARFRDADGGDVRESLNTLFYHDHRPEFTAANTYKGLMGFFRIFDERDTGDETDPSPLAWRLPSGPFDVPLALADKRFDPATGLLFFDQFTTDGFLGDKLTVNGKIQPFFAVERCKYRFRLLNGGPSRFYTLVLRQGGANRPFTQITEDGNFLQSPRTLSRIEVWVAERPDIVVDFGRFRPGDRVHLANILPMRPDGRGAVRGEFLNPDDPANQLLEFRVLGGRVSDPSRVPAFFRPFPPVNLDEVVRTRVWEFERDNGMWAINGQLFDPDIDHSPAFLAHPRNQVGKNTAEIWVLENSSGGWEHPIHIHQEESLIIKVNGVPVAAGQAARQDMFKVGHGTRIEAFRRFRDFPDPDFVAPTPADAGRYVMHCHNTVHEDHAMMTSWTVVP